MLNKAISLLSTTSIYRLGADTKTMRTECTSNKEGIVENGKEVEDIDEFVFLGAIVNKEGGGCKDVGNRLKKECSAFQRL